MHAHILDQLADIKQAVDGAVRRENETAKHFARNAEARNMYTTNGTEKTVLETGGGGGRVGKTVASPAVGRVGSEDPTPNTRFAKHEPHSFFPFSFFLSSFLSFIVPTSV